MERILGTGQGPYPALTDEICTYSDHLALLVAPEGHFSPLVCILSAHDNLVRIPLFILHFICYLAVPFGHYQKCFF